MRSYFILCVALAALVAINFGANMVNFSTSKEFAIIDFDWCKGEKSNFLCTKGETFGSLITGGVFWGAAVGSFFIGVLGKYGRRKAMILIHIVNIVGALMSASAMCFTMLLLGRFIAGLSVGASGVVPIFLSEICTSDRRGTFGIVYPLFISVGQLFMVAWQLIHGRVPMDVEGKPFAITTLDKAIWRMAQLWPAVLSVGSLFILFTLVKDDTPHVLLGEGKEEDAKRVIGMLHGEENVETVLAEVRADQEALKGDNTTVGFIAALKTAKYRRPLLILVGMAIAQQISGINVFIANASKIFVSIMGRSFMSTIVGSSTVLVLLISTVVCGIVIEKYGRRTLFLFGIAMSSVLLVPPVIIKIAAPPAEWVNIVLAIGCIGYVAGFAIGMGGVLWLYFAEAFGAEYKDAGFAAATCSNWITGAIIVTSSDVLLSWNEKFVYGFYAVLTILSLVYVYFFTKETRGIPLGQAYA